LVFAYGALLLVQALAVGGELDLAEHQLYLAFEVGQGFLQLGHRGLVAVALIVLARDAQVLGVLVDDRDVAQLVAPAGHAVDAHPAGEGDAQGQQQHQAEADPQFAIDAYIPQ
jgi:hypothetical protein